MHRVRTEQAVRTVVFDGKLKPHFRVAFDLMSWDFRFKQVWWLVMFKKDNWRLVYLQCVRDDHPSGLVVH